ncbi:MAG: hypothetical protein RI861_08300, partial [Planktomarina sp.]|nr:hypothetical protein [Planktomarina sp.]
LWQRDSGYLIDCCGMKDLKDYVWSDATKFRDHLFAKGLNGASVARIFGSGFWYAGPNSI